MSCEFCGEPGNWRIPERGFPVVVAPSLLPDEMPRMREHYACEAHRRLVSLKYRWKDDIHYDDTIGGLPLKAIFDPRGFQDDVYRKIRELRDRLESS